MTGVGDYLAMGGYGEFVWASYGIATLVLVGLLLQSRHALKQHENLLRQLRAARRGDNDE